MTAPASIRVARRQFLRGAGGFTLALPILPSLQPRNLWAAGPVREKHFVALMTDHGGVLHENMFPAAAGLTSSQELYPGHTAKWGPLVVRNTGDENALCPTLRASSTVLTNGLVGKMNVLEGFHCTLGISHNRGLHMGNYAANDGNGTSGKAAQSFPMPTIDQVMGWSPSFYSSLNGVKERVMVTGSRNGYSYGWSNPQAKSGSIQEIATNFSPRQLFDRIFVPGGSSVPATPPRKAIVDRVLDNYRRLRNSNARISLQDKQRLEDHLGRLNELERKVNAMPPVASKQCGQQPKPTSDGDGLSRFALLNDVFVTAFICGSSRIASMSITNPLVQFSGSWHQDVAHKGFESGPQSLLVGHNQKVFSGIFLDLARKLDAVDLGGHTLLDDTLIAWTQECAAATHESYNVPVVTIGSAGGAFKTGLHCDYRYLNPKSEYPYVKGKGLYPGLPWNQYLGNVLVAMGIPRGEFETGSMKGYGHYNVDGSIRTASSLGSIEGASKPLPFVTV